MNKWLFLLFALFAWCMVPVEGMSNIVKKQIVKQKADIRATCHMLHNSDQFVHKREVIDVLSLDQCEWIIHEAEKYAKEHGWAKERHENYPTVDNEIGKIETVSNLVNHVVYMKIMPEIARLFGVDLMKLGINDVFIAKYSMGGQKKLDMHQDGSEFSFVVALNDGFTGGGTTFEKGDQLQIKPGQALIFSGQSSHRGNKIKSGCRYILVGFLNYGWEDACQDGAIEWGNKTALN